MSSVEDSEDAFESSLIPAKRRRISHTLFDDIESDDNSFQPNEPVKKTRKTRNVSEEQEESGDGRVGSKAKKPKHLMRITDEPVASLKDRYYTQAPAPSSSPYRIRGAIWQKPQAPPEILEEWPEEELGNGVRDHHTISGDDWQSGGGSRGNNVVKETTQRPDGVPAAQRLAPGQHAFKQISANEVVAPTQVDYDLAQDLEDLPSDAFASSSSPSKSPERDYGGVINISSQPGVSPARRLTAPQNGLRQLTLFGDPAQQMTEASQQTKKSNWPAVNKVEKPTHHKMDEEAMKTWVYPTNLGTIRDYQYNIVARGLFHNLLVALPTGLGKTFIAATVMLNWFRWTKDAQIVFVAPTKPLVSQQIEACFGIAGIPRSQTAMLTGTISPGTRAEAWAEKRVFFMTPQTIVNDLKTGICDPKRIVLLVVDEAHRATGGYAYVEVVKFLRRFNESFRVLALTATPGASVEAVQEVIDGLSIARVEIRTEFSLDIRQYVHSRNTETVTFENSEEMELVMDLFSKALQPVLNKLNQFNAYWSKDPMMLTAYGLTQARQRWMGTSGKNASFPVKAMVNNIFTVLSSLAHNIELLKFHGIGPFYHGLVNFRNNQTGAKGGRYAKEIMENENFVKMMTRLQFWINQSTFVGHPKLDYLQGVVLDHFVAAGEGRAGSDHPPSATRIMIFAHFRDSAEEIVRVLKRNEPMIRPHVFVGQAASKGSEGMGQKRQLEIIQQFKTGKYNTLVATSIGEEGLDIGEVDLIICYDSSASPIRMLQRMGRTGRKRAGNIVLLLMKGKEENSFIQAKDNYEKMQQMIAAGTRFTFHDEQSPRILPKEVQPVVDRRVVEIPIENTQAELPEPKQRKGRAPKRPPKKFHMPDGVRTGFTTASRLGDDGEAGVDEGDEDPLPSRSKQTKLKTVEYASIPSLEEVLLSRAQQQELSRQYRDQVVGEDDDTPIMVPALDLHPAYQRKLTITAAVKHGSTARNLVSLLNRMHNTTSARISELKDISHMQDLDELCDVHSRVVDESSTDPPARTTKKPGAKPKKASAPAISLDSDIDLPDIVPPPQPAKKPRGRPKKSTTSNDPETPNAHPPPQKSRGRPTKAPTTTTTTTRANTTAHSSPPNHSIHALDAAIGTSSSPPPTDPRYALASQGITLGTQDTEGEDNDDADADDVLDSDLRDFVVEGDEEDVLNATSPVGSEIEEVDGRALARGVGRRGRGRLVGGRGRGREVWSDEEDEGMEVDGDREGDSDDLPDLPTVVARSSAKAWSKKGTVQRNKKRRMVVDDDDDSD